MRYLGLIFLLLFSQPSRSLNCHPEINPKLSQYVIGYGSLIDEKSKKITDSSAGVSLPVIVKGYKRSWSVHGTLPGFNTTFLSVVKDSHSSFNGIIFKLNNPENIYQYDKREYVYCRRELRAANISIYSRVLPEKKQIWIYTPIKKTPQKPTQSVPIIQSYVDIFIRGCLQIEEKYKIKEFAKDCINSTDQWSTNWVNDRIFPRRPKFYEPYAIQIDTLLKENLPEKFKRIKIE